MLCYILFVSGPRFVFEFVISGVGTQMSFPCGFNKGMMKPKTFGSKDYIGYFDKNIGIKN